MSAIQRWITLARDVDQEVLDWVDTNWCELPQSYIVGNKFLTGKGEDWRARLSKQYGVLALSILKEDLDLPFDRRLGFPTGKSSSEFRVRVVRDVSCVRSCVPARCYPGGPGLAAVLCPPPPAPAPPPPPRPRPAPRS